MKQEGSKEGRSRVMQRLLISKKGRRFFLALICLTIGAIYRRSIDMKKFYRRAKLLWEPANLRGVDTSSGGSGSTTGSRHRFLVTLGRPRCCGVVAGSKLLGGASVESTDWADGDAEARRKPAKRAALVKLVGG